MDTMPEPTPVGETVQEGVTEPDCMSNQLFELATSSITMGVLMEIKGMDWSTAHTAATVNEFVLD